MGQRLPLFHSCAGLSGMTVDEFGRSYTAIGSCIQELVPVRDGTGVVHMATAAADRLRA